MPYPSDTSNVPEKRKRSREGCFQCRGKKRKCDQAHPRCSLCIRHKSECTYPGSQPGSSSSHRGFSTLSALPQDVAGDTPWSLNAIPSSESNDIHPDIWRAFADQMESLSSLPQPVQEAQNDFPSDFFAEFLTDYALPSDSANTCPSVINVPGSQLEPSEMAGIGGTLALWSGWQGGLSTGSDVGQTPSSSNQHAPGFIPMPTAPALPKVAPGAQSETSMEEMKAFWVDLNKFYAFLIPQYYFSSSPGERVHIVEEIFRSGLPGPHLAAKSFLCAVWHTWTLRTTGRDARKVEEWQNRTKSFLRACNQLAQNHVTPLFDRVGSLLDVRLGHLLQDQVEDAQHVLEVCDSIVEKHLGKRSTYTLSERLEKTTISYQTYVFSDICRCLITRRLPTFHLSYSPTSGPGENLGVLIILGMPANLLPIFDDIAVASCIADATSPEKVAANKRVSDSLNAWIPMIRGGLSSTMMAEVVSTQMMWREVARMLALQYCSGKGILSKAVQDSLAEFLRAADSLPDEEAIAADEPRMFVPGSRACAWFIAAACTVYAEDRELCMRGLHSCGRERMYRDNARVIQRLWDRMDERGHLEDWRDFVAEQEVQVTFI